MGYIYINVSNYIVYIKQNGKLSRRFPIKTGIRLGDDSHACLVFNLSLELLETLVSRQLGPL